MSLAKAVLSIVANMEEDIKDAEYVETSKILRSHIRALKSAVESSGGVDASPIQSGAGLIPGTMIPDTEAGRRSYAALEQDRQNRRRRNEQEDMAESGEVESKRLVGGVNDGDMAPVPSTMPVGARTLINGTVYELRTDGCLHMVHSIIVAGGKNMDEMSNRGD